MQGLTSGRLMAPSMPIWSLLLAAFIGLGLSLSALADNHQKKELQQLKTSISSLEKKLRNQRKEKNTLQQQLETIERDIRDLNKKNRNIGKKITKNENDLSLLKSKKNNLEQRIENQRSTIAQQIQAAYKTGNEEPVKLLLNQENPEQLSRILKYYDYLLEARSKKIDQFTADIESLKITLSKIQSIKASLADSRKELEKDQQKLARNLGKRKTTLNKLSQSLQSNNQQLNQYKKQRDELETVIETVEKAARAITPAQDYPSFALSKGKLNWPVRGKLKASFGSKRSEYLRWQGWLISAKEGANIQSVHYGRVVFSDYLRGFGLLVIVDHGDGYMSLYAHNKELLRETGDWVQSGEIVARAGNTGGLTQTALYFEVREQGKPVNPRIWLINR
jgi:septal ring factor EnvC (AmiA/AmiB activator)